MNISEYEDKKQNHAGREYRSMEDLWITTKPRFPDRMDIHSYHRTYEVDELPVQGVCAPNSSRFLKVGWASGEHFNTVFNGEGQ